MKLPTHFCRTALFTPADQVDRYKKAEKIKGCDAIVIDLEDGVGIENKDTARKTMFDFFSTQSIQADHPMLVFLRINSPSTIDGLQDILALLNTPSFVPDGLLIPKVESRFTITWYRQLFCHPRYHQMSFIALIETAQGLEFAHDIATDPSVSALVFGGADLTSDLNAELTFESTLAYRSRIVQAAKSSGKMAWDVPYLFYKDPHGLQKETSQVKKIGFSCKLAIHPQQIPTISHVFSPSSDEIDTAKKILDISRLAKGGACSYQGKMIDTAITKQCHTILQKADTFSLEV